MYSQGKTRAPGRQQAALAMEACQQQAAAGTCSRTWQHPPCRKHHGMPGLSYQESLRQMAAVIFHSHNAVIPAIPLSPHAHVIGSLTARPASALTDGLARYCAQYSQGVVFISTGSSLIPGKRHDTMHHSRHKNAGMSSELLGLESA